MAHQVPPKSAVVTIKLTPDQHRLIDRSAKECGVRMSVWMRSILLQAAKAAPERVGRGTEGYLRIRVPDGATT